MPPINYLSETTCPKTLLTSYVKKGYELLKYVRSLHPTEMNISAVQRAISQTLWLIEKNTSHLQILVTERLSEEIEGELRIEDIVNKKHYQHKTC